MTSDIFKRNAITVVVLDFEVKLGGEIFLNTLKNGRKVVGYEIQITEKKG